jgi:hypothetical protein
MILIFHFVIDEEYVESLIEVKNKIRKPMAIATNMEQLKVKDFGQTFKTIKPENMSKILRKLYESGISMHYTEQDAAKTLMALLKYKEFLDKNKREIES